MNCQSCGAPMRLAADRDCFICDYCKSVYLPEVNDDGVRVLHEPSELSCPICAVPLVHASVTGERILYCTQCRGMLIQMDVFLSLIDELPKQNDGHPVIPHAPDPRDLERHIDCPECHHRMDTHYYAGPGNVILDDCSRCSWNWLDYGELMKIAHAPDHTYNNVTVGW
ncbi:MAG TPA: zf-TFIIB domain-containing protein [Bryobacteraceae bacterium]|nr:zf-TFIIB domain-containing protein [Bryobacteraceae bacterium]